MLFNKLVINIVYVNYIEIYVQQLVVSPPLPAYIADI
jgi:hypothetical protein